MRKNELLWNEVEGLILDELVYSQPGTDEFDAATKNLKDFTEARAKIAPMRLDPNKVLTATVYIGGIALVALLDQHVPFVSRVTGFLMKLKP